MNVLAIEPFYGGSHRAYLDGVVRHSAHRWSLLTAAPVHWKWRMRSAPLELSARLTSHLDEHGQPDVIWCSSMLDLPTWQGFAAAQGLARHPTVAYFHESQWTYPQRKEARVDFHYGYTNLLTALSADCCAFNSHFHRDEFLRASEQFIRRMPDARTIHDFERLDAKCQVIYPGFEPPVDASPTDSVSADSASTKREPLTIGWVSRWEHDKRPDRFVELLRALRKANFDFQLVLLGPRPRDGASDLETIRNEFSEAIKFDGFATTYKDYVDRLTQIDIVVSTADHEFFGIAICEAIQAGAIAVVPDCLSYPEIVSTPTRYQSIEHAARIIERLSDRDERARLVAQGREHLTSFRMKETVSVMDETIEEVVTDPHTMSRDA